MNKCDIIIPIYNAYDDVIECIDSVLKNTNFEKNRLILIDDKSTDIRIQSKLKEYAKRYSKEILLLTNKENLGFIGTVNRGMKESDNDVLLLNSDTEVTSHWLEKIQKCAYSSDDIATVTPLSNNATLASVPKSFEPNELPDGFDLEEMNKLVEECSYNHYPEIPTGHGFCLYIKRTVLETVGYFDEKSYGKGYGEENDFCFRCFKYGYRHILCDNTYILHKESKSFLESKNELIKSGLEVLEKKYPHYKHELDVWIQNRPIDYIGNNIGLAIGLRNNKPNILYIIHDWKDIKQNLGGTSLHAWDLIKHMNNKYNFHIFSPENGNYKVYSYFGNSECVIKYPMPKINMTVMKYYNNEYKRLFSEIIDNYGISYVHIHHIIGHYFDIADVLKEKKVKYAITLHDFYSVCPLINKLYKLDSYCELKPTINKCNECLKYVYKTDVDIESWRNCWKNMLDGADYIFTPSDATKNEISLIYNNKIKVIEHGVDLIKEDRSIELSSKNDIAFIGAIGFHKGSQILEKFILKDLIKNAKIHLFGKIDSPYDKNNKHFINHGTYRRNELNQLLKDNNIKLICLFSIWPETYSYTLTEAIASGIPVISFDYGAIGERIKKYNLGWVINYTNDVNRISKEIETILSNSYEYNKKIDSIKKYRIITVEEMVQKYINIYDNRVISKQLSSSLKNVNYNNRSFNSFVTYQDYSWILNTLKWKIISKLKIPKFIKKIFKKNK